MAKGHDSNTNKDALGRPLPKGTTANLPSSQPERALDGTDHNQQ